MKLHDQFIQLQLQDVEPEINKLLLDFDLVLRVGDNNKYTSFAIENHKKKEIATHSHKLED
tara:strand:- start:3032 stop:3214 length:183 start_codon:yes stop_codon:yes gene_type:complete